MMKSETYSSSLVIHSGVSSEDMAQLQKFSREDFTSKCWHSSDARVPASEDLDRWWPLTAPQG